MCIAILKTKKGKISDEALRNSFRRNKDGAGIAYTVNNELIIEKGIFDEDQFVNAVREAEKRCDNNMLIHCRIGTSGLMDTNNTHPFMVNDKVCLIHNGILDIDVPKTSLLNDTQIFIKYYLKDMNTKELMHNEQYHRMLGDFIGKNNKFVLLDNKGYYKIINEKSGHWKDNVWYSNDSYKEVKTYATSFWNKFDNYRDYRLGNRDKYKDAFAFNYEDDDEYLDCDDRLVSQDTLYAIEDAICNLTDERLLTIGTTPMYVYETEDIISSEEYYSQGWSDCDYYAEPIYSIDEDLYKVYRDLYEDAQKNYVLD